MNYAIRLHAVFNNLEDLKDILQDVIDNAENFGLDNYPNCGCNTHDFDIVVSHNEDVYDFMNKLKLDLLLNQTSIYEECKTFKEMLDRLDEYINDNDVNKWEIKSILTKLI